MAAVGVNLYLAGQSYDPNGGLYSANGYLVSAGTSFSAPQVAGVAALLKQQHPNLSALQIKSAVVDTATQDVTEDGGVASVLAVGAGKVNAGFAVTNNSDRDSVQRIIRRDKVCRAAGDAAIAADKHRNHHAESKCVSHPPDG